MKKELLFFTVFSFISMLLSSCIVERHTTVVAYFDFYNDTEHVIEIKNHWGNGQIDYYKINPGKYLFFEKSTVEPGAAEEKPDNYIEHVSFARISPFSYVEKDGYVEVIFDEEHISYHFLNRHNFELPDWYEDGKYYAPTDSRSLANIDAYTFDLHKRKKRKSPLRYDVHYQFTEADYLEAVND